MSEEQDKYQQLEHREHIYKLPDTYIGSIESATQELFIVDEEDRMTSKEVTYVPGFFKIFDEILVNATDHRQRDETVKNIKITLDLGLTDISILNDGNGIDVYVHPTTGIYVPEMLFGHLLTSSNYNENEKRTVGGKNGYGATVTNIFSEYFIVETVDQNRQLKYVQKFSNNGQTIHPHKITKYSSKPYTKITFKPDYNKFKLDDGITPDIYALFKKRVYDITAVTPKDLNVWFNGTKLKTKSMEKYIELYSSNKPSYVEFFRWKIGLVLSPNREYFQTSFVNGIWTMKGGRHVDYVLNQVIDRLKQVLSRNSRTKNRVYKPSQLRDNIWLFIDCVIENPSFTSQTKEEMTSKISQFGSTCVIEEKWVEKWVKQNDELIERLLENSKIEEQKNLKKTDGNKRSVIKGIPKLDDAIHAGTRNSTKCTLILCEGDSAKASILAGVSVLGTKREYYGIFPLRGKFLNVRDISSDKINSNEEVKNLKIILGLQHNKTYTSDNIKELRYGSIAIATDADCDGSHIKGLIMNFFHYFWPSLLKIDGFLKTLYTPIVKGMSTGGQVMSFYNLRDYHSFKEQHSSSKWNYKYFKGLGTSTSKEFKDYFKNLNDITVNYTNPNDESLLMAFSKDKSDQRKAWLQMYDPDDIIHFSTQLKTIPISEFVHKELKHFSNYDNYRSIPNVLDGLKPSQRKVLYGLFKKGNIKEIKVAQLASYVSEVTQYHHGEVSLEQTIVGMAQRFVGKNNLPLLKAIGQFGTRLSGKDNAQSRYIFTALQDYTHELFNSSDENLLEFLEEEDKSIEPFCYYPILPTILINGADGIGTGYSTQIPCFNPNELLDAILQKNLGIPFKTDWIPYYTGFKGTITPVDSNYKKFTVNGVYKLDEQKLVVTELPIGVWTNTFKEHLEHLITTGTVISYINKSTDEIVHFEIQLGKVDSHNIEKVFKLQNTISLNNMHAYKHKLIHKFETIGEVLEYFYEQRIHYYGERKKHLLKQFRDKIDLLEEKIRFIKLVLEQPEIIFRQSKKTITKILESKQFVHIDTLIQLPIYHWSLEKIEELEAECAKTKLKHDQLEIQTETNMYTQDLTTLKKSFVG